VLSTDHVQQRVALVSQFFINKIILSTKRKPCNVSFDDGVEICDVLVIILNQNKAVIIAVVLGTRPSLETVAEHHVQVRLKSNLKLSFL
jgi:hypothetical protein